MFTDEEWNIKKYPMVALYQNNRSPTEKDISFTSEYKCIERLSPQSTFYVDKAKPGDVKQGRLRTRVFILYNLFSMILLSKR